MSQHSIKLMGRKRGMVQIFDEDGRSVPCTVLQIEPNVVVHLKTKESDGYNAVQLSAEIVKAKDPRRKTARTKKPQRGHFEKAGVEARRHLLESRVENNEKYSLGQEIGAEHFADITYVDVCGTSKGKGFQGVMKLHGFKGGPAAHGSGFHRTAGSTGCRSTPGRNFPGGKRASQMGNRRVTVQSLNVVKVDADKQLVLVKGAVPGPTGSLVTISEAVKRPAATTKK